MWTTDGLPREVQGVKGCFILGNGPSLLEHDVSDLEAFPSFGTNRSFEVVDSTYHVVVDKACFDSYAPALEEWGIYLFCPPGSPFGSVIPQLGRRRSVPQFGTTLEAIHWRFAPYAAIQVAYALGYRRMVLIGVDLCEHNGKGHFYDRPMGLNLEPFQREGFGYIAGLAPSLGLQIVTCSSITQLRAFPRVSMSGALQFLANA